MSFFPINPIPWHNVERANILLFQTPEIHIVIARMTTRDVQRGDSAFLAEPMLRSPSVESKFREIISPF